MSPSADAPSFITVPSGFQTKCPGPQRPACATSVPVGTMKSRTSCQNLIFSQNFLTDASPILILLLLHLPCGHCLWISAPLSPNGKGAGRKLLRADHQHWPVARRSASSAHNIHPCRLQRLTRSWVSGPATRASPGINHDCPLDPLHSPLFQALAQGHRRVGAASAAWPRK
jgi:hypothetical protein